MESKTTPKAKFIQEIETKSQKLWEDFVTMNTRIETSMKGINANTNELMGLFKETTEKWVNEIISAMKKMTLIMNQCEIITKEFKQVEQIAKQTEYLKIMLEATLHMLEHGSASPK